MYLFISQGEGLRFPFQLPLEADAVSFALLLAVLPRSWARPRKFQEIKGLKWEPQSREPQEYSRNLVETEAPRSV